MTPEQERDLLRAGRKARAARATLARIDPNAFVEFVIKDEETGAPIRQGPVHPVWHRLAEEHSRIIVWATPESGKSLQLAVARTLWILGRNPNLRIAIWSAVLGLAVKTVKAIRRYIEMSEELREVFPALRPSDLLWTDAAFTVQRTTHARAPSVQAIATYQQRVLGERLDRVIGDDVVNEKNTLTAAARESTWRWFHSTLLRRLRADGTMTIICNAWHHQDLLHRLAGSPGKQWVARKFPIIDKHGNSTWPGAWPLARIREAEIELGPIEADRQLRCRPFSDEAAMFKTSWFTAGKQRGIGKRLLKRASIDDFPPGTGMFTGVDVAASEKSTADESAIVTIAVLPDLRRQVLAVEGGRWEGPVLRDHVIDHIVRFPDTIVMAETVGVQLWLLQFIREQAAKIGFLPLVLPFATGRNKHDPAFGFESLAAEISGDDWIFPSPDGVEVERELGLLIQDLQYYKRGAHTGDYAMAMWLARECARRWGKRGRPARRPIPGAAPPKPAAPPAVPRKPRGPKDLPR